MDKVKLALTLALTLCLLSQARAQEFPLHGFVEGAYGIRIVDDPGQARDTVLGEGRVQLEYSSPFKKRWEFFIKSDFIGDGVGDSAIDLRELRLDFTPWKNLDIRLGRHIITWGVGDFLFINDLFPKDYVSFFIGRDLQYLKLPSDGAKLSFYSPLVNADLIFLPFFTPNKLPPDGRLSFFDPFTGRVRGGDTDLSTRKPATRIENSELAIRLNQVVKGYELAGYFFRGFFKDRVEFLDAAKRRLGFPRLAAYGASLRGPVKGGVLSAEFGFYDSRQDRSGKDPLVENSSLKFLLGYEREWFKNLTGGLQYFFDGMQDYKNFLKFLPAGAPRPRRERHTLTVKLAQLLFNEELELNLFTFFSPSDGDAYFRPAASYKISDRWKITAGGNFFVGRKDFSFFGQLDDNDNVYLRIRYSF